MPGLKGLVQAAYLDAGLGIRVNRAAAAEPVGGAWQTLFTISGGPVIVTHILGRRTVIQAGGASTMQLRSSVGPTVLCAATAVTGDAVGTLYTITGDITTPAGLVIGAAGVPVIAGLGGAVIAAGAGAVVMGLIVAVGTIQVTCSAAAHTGSTAWVIHYVPLEAASVVTA